MKVKPAERLNAVQEYYFCGKAATDRSHALFRDCNVINRHRNPDQSPSENTIRQLCSEASKPEHPRIQKLCRHPRPEKGIRRMVSQYFKSAS